MRFSLSTGTLYIYPLRTVFRWARDAGFDGVELSVNPEAIARGGHQVRQMAEAEGIEITSVHPTVVPLPGWQERHGGMDRTIRLAQEARAGLVVLHTPRSVGLEMGPGLSFQRQIDKWQPRLFGSDLNLAIENKAIRSQADQSYVLTPLERLRAFADRFDLGLVLDTTHAATAGENLARARQIFDGRLVNVHLSDMGGRIPLSALPHAKTLLGQHRFPGEGDLKLKALVADLLSCHYAGPVTLEVNPFAVRVWWPPAVRRRLAQAVAWLSEAARMGSVTSGS